jgi:type III secretory pathway component EscS
MDTEKLKALEEKIDAIYKSVETTRKYFLVTLIVSVAVIVLPMIGLVFLAPSLMDTATQYQELLK